MRRSQLALVAALWACGAPADPDVLPGAWWAGERPAVEALLEQVAALEGTPLGAAAAALRSGLPAGCPRLGFHAPEGGLADLPGGARCLAEGDPLGAALARARRSPGGPVELAFAAPAEAGGALGGTVRVEGGAVSLAIDWRGARATGPLALLLPGARGAGPERLARAGRLLHLLVRPEEGLDLATLAPAESQADRLFRLRSGLFASAVLDGAWELALYEPEGAGDLPPAALALGARSRTVAAAAAERFLAELAATWSVPRSDFALAEARGACLLDLNVLPELAPCYVVTGDSLVLGWNPRSLERALGDATPAAVDGAPAQLEIDLARMARSDARAAARLAGEPGLAPRAIAWPWRRLEARARREGDSVRIEARLGDLGRGPS